MLSIIHMQNIHKAISTDQKIIVLSRYLIVLLIEELLITGISISSPIMWKISPKVGLSVQDSTIQSHKEDLWINIDASYLMVLSEYGFIVEILMMLCHSLIPKRMLNNFTELKLENGALGM